MTRLLLSCVVLLSILGTIHCGKYFERIFIIVLEDQDFASAANDTNLLLLRSQGKLLANYTAVAHPSQPNYIAMIAGDTLNVTDDSTYNISASSIVDLFDTHNVTWKAYQESYPIGACFAGDQTADGLYQRKHNPFISFDSIRNNATRCANIVPSEQLYLDIQSNKVPQFSFYVPNVNDNGHNTGLAYSSAWASLFMPTLLNNTAFMKNTLVVLTFDEAATTNGTNQVFTLLFGVGITAKSSDSTAYNHYSLLSTIEDNWGLPSLGRYDTNSSLIVLPLLYPPAPVPPYVVIFGQILPDSIIIGVLFGFILSIVFLVVTILGCMNDARRRQGLPPIDFM